MTVGKLADEITTLAAHMHAAMCRWLVLVAEFDRLEGWANTGCKSCADWISWRCAVAPGAAREHVRVARRLEGLPLVREAFGRGELSYSKVRALTRVESMEDERTLLELARDATAAQLERIVRAYRGVVRAEDARAIHRERRVSLHQDADGSWVLSGRLPAEDGALLAKALEAARDELRSRASAGTGREAADVPADTRVGVPAGTSVSPGSVEEPDYPYGASMADALVLVADSMLATGPRERNGGDRYQVIVHVDADMLAGDANPERLAAAAGEPDRVPAGTPAGRCELDSGAPLAAETARRLACDASIVTMRERDGAPLSVGRKTRSVPPALRRALQRRDHCCQFPGCNQRRALDAHHIQHWARGGETSLDNLTQLCRFHHRLLHEGGYRLTRRGHRLEFHTPTGQPIPHVPKPRRGDHAQIHDPARSSHIHPDTCGSRCNGERYDLGMAVDLVLNAA